MTFEQRVIAYMEWNDYRIDWDPGHLNIVYVEGADADGRENADQLDGWNDRRLVIGFEAGTPVLLHNARATTEPGLAATMDPAAAKRGGVFRIMLGQHLNCWVDGFHKGNVSHPALVHYPGAKILGHRDANRDGKRTGDLVGLGYGINQHSTQPLFERETVGRYSEGCLVGWNWQEHLEFVRLYRSDARYVQDRLFRFSVTVIPADDLQKHFPFGDVY